MIWSTFGYFDLYAILPPPSSILDTPPEIDFFDVSDDLEQKKEKYKKNFQFFLENVRKLPRRVRNVQKLPRRVTAENRGFGSV